MNTKAAILPPCMTEQSKVILFDGTCRFCNFWVRFIIKNDQQKLFKLAAVQSREGRKILQHFAMSTEVFDSMLFIDGYRSYTKSDAALRIARQLQQPWRSLVIIKFIPTAIRDAIYDLIAKNRYRLFGQYDYCLLPTADYKGRFLNSEDCSKQ